MSKAKIAYWMFVLDSRFDRNDLRVKFNHGYTRMDTDKSPLFRGVSNAPRFIGGIAIVQIPARMGGPDAFQIVADHGLVRRNN